MIIWTDFDWQSFATLATGALAVGGAVIVGKRQLKIAEQQNSILAKQTELAELTLRHELFDRRAAIYEAASDYLGAIIIHAAPPDSDTDHAFISAKRQARLIFRPQVYLELDQIWKRGCDFRALYMVSRATYDREGHYGDGNPEREAAMLKKFHQDIEGLVDLFGDEMRLSRNG